MLLSSIKNMSDEIRDEIICYEAVQDDLSNSLQNGVQCAVLEVECHIGDIAEDNYYTIAFTNSVVVTGISGRHLSGIEKWKD